MEKTCEERIAEITQGFEAVSYTHLDVYKRQTLPGALGKVGLINPISHRFCSDCNRIRLTADGKLKPCLHSDEELDVKALRRAGRSYREILEMAVSAKPERHHIDEHETIKKRNMNEIGG